MMPNLLAALYFRSNKRHHPPARRAEYHPAGGARMLSLKGGPGWHDCGKAKVNAKTRMSGSRGSYSWLTEGFDTKDLLEAKTLLADLRSRSTIVCSEEDARMAKTQTKVLPTHDARKPPTAVVLAALGVVYGDIGTSTLYGLKQAVEAGGTPTSETVLGIVSVILWSLLLIVALKYAILILRADNHGEGGIVALLALLDARHAPRGPAHRRSDWSRAALRRRRDHTGDFSTQRCRRSQDRCTGARADGGSHHHRDPGRSVPGPA
jgi:hypothetical protein